MADIHQRSGIPLEELEKNERTTTTDRPRRIAEFDWLQFRDSVQLNGPTDIALTFVDYFDVGNRKAFPTTPATLPVRMTNPAMRGPRPSVRNRTGQFPGGTCHAREAAFRATFGPTSQGATRQR